MKTQFRHLEFNITNLEKIKPLYEDIFKYFEFVIREETAAKITFISNESDFTFFNIKEDHPHFQEFVGLKEINFFVFSKNDVDRFFLEFLRPRNIVTIDDSPKFYDKNLYAVKFRDEEGFTWEVFHTPNGDTKTITQLLRKNFAKEFIYSVLLFPLGFWYGYKLFFKYNHKIAGIFCFFITIAVFILYAYSTIALTNSVVDSFKQASQYYPTGI